MKRGFPKSWDSPKTEVQLIRQAQLVTQIVINLHVLARSKATGRVMLQPKNLQKRINRKVSLIEHYQRINRSNFNN